MALFDGRTFVAAGVVGILMTLGLNSCAPVPSEMPAPAPVEQALFGKTKKDLLACATVQPLERSGGGKTVLAFYKEAPPWAESFAGTRSSLSKEHHGCLAHVELQDDRIQEIHYHAVPEAYPAYDHCDEIFAPCLGH